MKTTTKNLAKSAIFSALAYILTYLEIPLFPQASFLKLDFSNVFVLIGGFSLGPLYGVVILFVKEFLCALKPSTYFVVGQVANFLIGLSFILLPTIVYNFKKGIKTVLFTLLGATVLQVVVALLVNRFINFPLIGYPTEAFYSLFWVIFAFNAIKGVLVSVITILLYKRIKKVLDF